MNKPVKRCGCIFLPKKKIAEIAKFCLAYSKVAYNSIRELICNNQNKNKPTNYKNKKIGVV